MISTRDFDFREKYPGIPEEKISAIQKYYGTNIANVGSESSYRIHLKALCAMCAVLQEFRYIPFCDWDATVAISFLRSMESSSTYLNRIIPALKIILVEAGCKNDLSSVNLLNIASEYCSPLLSFEIFNTTMKRVFSEQHPLYTWSKTNSWTTGIVLCYLFWLGFTREDIYNLKNNDFDEKTCTIIYRGKNYVKQRNVTERIDKATSEYIRNYFRSKTYETYTEELGWRDIPYADGDTFVKLTSGKKSTMRDITNNHIQKMHNYMGLHSSEILTAGRMDRLYYLDKIKNVPISVKNAAVIAEDLGLSIPARIKCGTEIGNLILMYNSYKTKRETLYQNI